MLPQGCPHNPPAEKCVFLIAQDKLIGGRALLEPVFYGSIRVKPAKLRQGKYATVKVYHDSDIPYESTAQKNEGLSCIKRVIMRVHHVIMVEVRGLSDRLLNLSKVE